MKTNEIENASRIENFRRLALEAVNPAARAAREAADEMAFQARIAEAAVEAAENMAAGAAKLDAIDTALAVRKARWGW